ncbi:hypothetical protein WM27_24635 [Burkholderia ubonensis]|nr:hypothetical protein WM27_24635 [Burkholderia ubonensis]ODQ36907.1 hypothetical protein BGV65_04035 [Burkholderia ubonensis]
MLFPAFRRVIHRLAGCCVLTTTISRYLYLFYNLIWRFRAFLSVSMRYAAFHLFPRRRFVGCLLLRSMLADPLRA